MTTIVIEITDIRGKFYTVLLYIQKYSNPIKQINIKVNIITSSAIILVFL